MAGVLNGTSTRKAEQALEIREASGRYRAATKEEGIGTAQARFQKGAVINNPKDAHEFLKLELAHPEHEIFAVLWLDNQCNGQQKPNSPIFS